MADIKDCWICLSDETEPSSSTTRWVRPCRCSLVAHEHCLLAWIAAQDAQEGRQTGSSCPQCRSPFIVEQVIDRRVQLFDVAYKIAGTCSQIACEYTLFFPSSQGASTLRYLLGPSLSGQLLRLDAQAAASNRPRWINLFPFVVMGAAVGPELILNPRISTFLVFELFLTPALKHIIYPSPTPPLTLALSRVSRSTTVRSLLSGRSWFPPGPGLSMALIPAFGYAYSQLKPHLFEAILGKSRPARDVADIDPNPDPFQDFLPFRLIPLQASPLLTRAGAAMLNPILASFTGAALLSISPFVPGLGTLLGVRSPRVRVYRSEIGSVDVKMDRDRVWWRTAIGYACVALVKDAIHLLYLHLRMKQNRSRRIVSVGEQAGRVGARP